jgi:hypothetical protein
MSNTGPQIVCKRRFRPLLHCSRRCLRCMLHMHPVHPRSWHVSVATK